ncbi:MAG TPA: M23 family metallopeptidase [Chthoniobacterales bacterium]
MAEKRNRRAWIPLALTVSAVLLLGIYLSLRMTSPPPGANGIPDPCLQPVDAVTLATLPLATRFDFPMGSQNGALVYNAQRFTENRHLGDDLNGMGGENTDLGDPVFSVANGRVLYAGWLSDSWGNCVLLVHAYEENGARKYVQSFYGHLDHIHVKPNTDIKRGQQIGTVGTAAGKYLAHLHFEMREFATPYLGVGYRENPAGWIDPSGFLQTHRGAPESDLRPEP